MSFSSPGNMYKYTLPIEVAEGVLVRGFANLDDDESVRRLADLV